MVKFLKIISLFKEPVLDLGHDLQSFYQLLSSILSQSKLRYIFDGLGHLCASIFIHSSQHMPRLSDSAKKRVCRNIWGVQQRLSQITARREAELDRARAFFELLSHDTDRLMLLIPDRKSQFTSAELGHLITLSVRSNPTLANQHGALEQRLAQLSSILKEPV
uniref:Exocyst complex component Sec8 n=1 Tax=Heterorhabditis bacteriophora TaxID=37862 RepID=A0A1I7WFW0_HETBA